LHLFNKKSKFKVLNDMRMQPIEENLSQLLQRIDRACSRANRRPQEVLLVAVTKTIDIGRIREAIAAGVSAIGENRVQEAVEKFPHLPAPATVKKHLVGHLQTNKARKAVELFDVIQSVDSMRVARAIDQYAGQLGVKRDIFIEVNTSAEKSKFGVSLSEVKPLAIEIMNLRHVNLNGLMTVAAFLPAAEEVRPCFRKLRDLRDELQRSGMAIPHLSMGMTNDFEAAIEEGATIIRIGRALFGERT
jgi:PLP dependent protein